MNTDYEKFRKTQRQMMEYINDADKIMDQCAFNDKGWDFVTIHIKLEEAEQKLKFANRFFLLSKDHFINHLKQTTNESSN